MDADARLIEEVAAFYLLHKENEVGVQALEVKGALAVEDVELAFEEVDEAREHL